MSKTENLVSEEVLQEEYSSSQSIASYNGFVGGMFQEETVDITTSLSPSSIMAWGVPSTEVLESGSSSPNSGTPRITSVLPFKK